MPVNAKLRDKIVNAIKANIKDKSKNKLTWDKWYKEDPKNFIDTVCTRLPSHEYIERGKVDSIVEYLIRNSRETQLNNVLNIKGLDKAVLLSNVSKPLSTYYPQDVESNESALERAVSFNQPRMIESLLQLKDAETFKLSKAFKRTVYFFPNQKTLTAIQIQIAQLIAQFAIEQNKTSDLGLNDQSNCSYVIVAGNYQGGNVTPFVILINFAPEVAELFLRDKNTKIDVSTKKFAMKSAVHLNKHKFVTLLKEKAKQNDPQCKIYPDNILLLSTNQTTTLKALLTGDLQPDLSNGKFVKYVLEEPPGNLEPSSKALRRRLRKKHIMLAINSDQKDIGINTTLSFSTTHNYADYTAFEFAISKKFPAAHEILKANQLIILKSPRALEFASHSSDEKLFDKLLSLDGNQIRLNERRLKHYRREETFTVLEDLIDSANNTLNINKNEQGKKKLVILRHYKNAMKIITHKDFDASKNKFALFLAIESGREDLIKAIVTHKTFTSEYLDGTIKIKPNYRRDPIIEYSLLQYGLSKSVKGMITFFEHCPVPIKNISKDDSLLRIVNKGHVKLIELLIAHAKKHNIKDIGQYKQSPLKDSPSMKHSYSKHPLKYEKVSPLGHAIYNALAVYDNIGNERWKIVETLLYSDLDIDPASDRPFICAAAGEYATVEKFDILKKKYEGIHTNIFSFNCKGIDASLLAAFNGNVELFKSIPLTTERLDEYRTHRGLLWYSALSMNTKMLDTALDVANMNKINTKNKDGQSELAEVLYNIFSEFTDAYIGTEAKNRLNMIKHLLSKDLDIEKTLSEKDEYGETLFARLYAKAVPFYTANIMKYLKDEHPGILKSCLSAQDNEGRTVIHKDKPGPGCWGMAYPKIEKDLDEIKAIIDDLGLTYLIDVEIKKKASPKHLVHKKKVQAQHNHGRPTHHTKFFGEENKEVVTSEIKNKNENGNGKEPQANAKKIGTEKKGAKKESSQNGEQQQQKSTDEKQDKQTTFWDKLPTWGKILLAIACVIPFVGLPVLIVYLYQSNQIDKKAKESTGTDAAKIKDAKGNSSDMFNSGISEVAVKKAENLEEKSKMVAVQENQEHVFKTPM